jgi:predicted RNA binding protein YcfA (HicA-like mRNA interferase family)
MSSQHSGKDYVKAARNNGLRVEPGKGDHYKVYGPEGRGYMVVPMHRELANGTECSIKKWFKALGIVLFILPILACVLTTMGH